MYREWKKIGFPKEYCIWIWKKQDQEVDQETDGWMKWGRMEEWSAERSGRKKCMTRRNGRGSWERQGITAFCTCQWIDWFMGININENVTWDVDIKHLSPKFSKSFYVIHLLWYNEFIYCKECLFCKFLFPLEVLFNLLGVVNSGVKVFTNLKKKKYIYILPIIIYRHICTHAVGNVIKHYTYLKCLVFVICKN